MASDLLFPCSSAPSISGLSVRFSLCVCWCLAFSACATALVFLVVSVWGVLDVCMVVPNHAPSWHAPIILRLTCTLPIWAPCAVRPTTFILLLFKGAVGPDDGSLWLLGNILDAADTMLQSWTYWTYATPLFLTASVPCRVGLQLPSFRSSNRVLCQT